MAISDKAIQKVVPKKATGIQYESKLHKTASQYREYQSDPISFVDKYGEGAVEKLMAELNRPIGVTDENVPITTREHLDKKKKGGRIKYQSKGKVTSDKDADIRLAWRYAKAEAGSGGKEASEQDFYQALKRVKSSPEMVRKRLNELQAMGAAGKEAKGTYRFNPSSDYKKMKSSKLQPRGQLSEKLFQYGGIADMSAAPMIKQPQRKKRKASGFRTKYSKGGGVRSSKYKL